MEELISAALEEGFAAAAIVDTDKIVFDPSFRPYCAENLCGQYGANYSCPPDCGTPAAELPPECGSSAAFCFNLSMSALAAAAPLGS